MGVKRTLSLDDLKPYVDVQKITPTTNGISDSVFILDDKYVLKSLKQPQKKR